MGITTILPPDKLSTFSRTMEDVLVCLRRQPLVPLDLRVIAQNIAGASLAAVEKAAMELEGPVPGVEREAYVHVCRLNRQAVYIP